MKTDKINLFDHYRKLLFYTFNRFKGNNYSLMSEYFAQILITEIEEFMPLENKKVLDVGGAKGEFCKVIATKRKCDAINLDPYPGEYVWPKTQIGFADNIPFDNNKFDLVICRGVLEHIPTKKQQQCVNEMYRVTKTGGICYLMIPPWYNPHAGHSLKPFHTLPFKLARFLRQLIFRNRINADSLEEMGLYPVTFKSMLQMILTSGFEVISTKDTHFKLHFLTKIPVIREIGVPAVAFILTKK
jgi:SAM-dependent methyltransferase